MSESEELSEEEYELEWKNLDGKTPAAVRLKSGVNVETNSPVITLQLTRWQLALITDALCGRLSPERAMPANLLGVNLRKNYYSKQLQSAEFSQKIVQQCEEVIADIYNYVEMQKMQLDAWAKEQAKLTEVSEE